MGASAASHFKARLEMLKSPGFSWYLLSGVLACLGSGLGYITMCWIVVKIDPSVFAIAALTISFWIPNIILSPLAGVIVDRYPRRRVLFVSNLVRATLYFLYVFCWPEAIHTQLGLYILSVIQGIFFTVVMPCTTTFVREIIHQDKLLYANAMVDIAYEVGNMVGMGFAGLLIAAYSDQGALFINGSLFVFASIALYLIPKSAIRFSAKDSDQGERKVWDFFSELQLGWSYLFNNKVLLLIYGVQLLLFEQYMTLPILLIPFANKVLHANVGQLGMISAAMSVGIVVGGIILPWFCDRFGLLRITLIMFLVSGVSFILFAFNHLLGFSELLYFILGFSVATWPMLVTLAQDKTEMRFQGRVQSLFGSLAAVIMVLIYLALSLADDYFGLRWLYFFETLLSMVGFYMMMCYSRRNGSSL